jgi:hypothetical protein
MTTFCFGVYIVNKSMVYDLPSSCLLDIPLIRPPPRNRTSPCKLSSHFPNQISLAICSPRPEFVNVYGAQESIQRMIPPAYLGLSYRPARLHRLVESIPWNRFLSSLNVYKFGLRSQKTFADNCIKKSAQHTLNFFRNDSFSQIYNIIVF